MKRQLVICMISILLLAFIGISLDYAIIQDVISSGAQNASSMDYVMDATLGQPATGESASADYGWCHGFWCGLLRQIVTGPTTIAVGQATLIYQFTFDDLGMALGIITLATLVAGRWLYDNTLQLWRAA